MKYTSVWGQSCVLREDDEAERTNRDGGDDSGRALPPGGHLVVSAG